MMTISREALDMAAKVEAFVRETVVPYEQDPRRDHHGAPTDELVMNCAKGARGGLTPHIRPDGSHLTQRETAVVLIRRAFRRWAAGLQHGAR
jgi:acyl-CoA dehydrogenase